MIVVIIAIAISVIANLISDDLAEFLRWIATRLVRWSASQAFPEDLEQAKARAEELEAYVDAVRGTLPKLGAGLGFGAAGVRDWTVRSFIGRPSWLRTLPTLPAVVVVPLAVLLFVLSFVFGLFLIGLVLLICFTKPPLAIGLTVVIWAPIVGFWVRNNFILGAGKGSQAEAADSYDPSMDA